MVVLGLLIGLQLNDWAQARQDRQLVANYYQQLVLDLEMDIGMGEAASDYADNLDRQAAIVGRVLVGDTVSDVGDGDLLRAIVTAGYSFRPFTNRQTYDELINTGSLGLIHDVEVKRAIGFYYIRRKNARQWDALVQHEQKAYRDAIRGVLTPEQMRWVRMNLGADRTPLPKVERNELLANVQRREAIGAALSPMAGVQARLRDQGSGMQEEARALIDILRAGL